jgi:hypothetical protein
MTLPPPRPEPRTPRGAASDEVDPTRAVDRALAELDGLADRPLAEHVAVFERIHTVLGDALAAGPGAGEAAGRA